MKAQSKLKPLKAFLLPNADFTALLQREELLTSQGTIQGTPLLLT